MSLRALVLLPAFATLSACAGSAPVVEALPPQPVSVPPPASPPRPPPVPEPVAVVVPEAPPAPPPSAPRGTLESRATYERADVSEWILTNGATVVFKPLPSGGRVRMEGSAVFAVPGDPACERRAYGEAPAGDLSRLFQTSLGPRGVYVVVGDAQPGEVEAAAARLLTLPAGEPRCVGQGFVGETYRATAPPESDAVLAVLAELLRATTYREERSGTVFLSRQSSSDQSLASDLAGIRPTAAELATARAAAAMRVDRPDYWTEALANLYRTPGDLRPSRDPSFVADFPSRVARVSAQAVADLAARLAASPVN